jgi:hypothetical protein
LKRTIATLATTAAAIAASTGLTIAAQASTPAASGGVLGAYTGDQVDGNQLTINDYGQNASPNATVAAWTVGSSYVADDFAWFTPSGTFASGAKQVMYVPGGKLTGLCLSDPAQVYAGHANADGIVLRACQGNDAYQVWTFNGTGWTNAKTGGVLTENGKGKELTDSVAVTGSKAQAWTFQS